MEHVRAYFIYGVCHVNSSFCVKLIEPLLCVLWYASGGKSLLCLVRLCSANLGWGEWVELLVFFSIAIACLVALGEFNETSGRIKWKPRAKWNMYVMTQAVYCSVGSVPSRPSIYRSIYLEGIRNILKMSPFLPAVPCSSSSCCMAHLCRF